MSVLGGIVCEHGRVTYVMCWGGMDSPHKGQVMQKALPCHDIIVSMDLCKKDVTPLLTHWSYVFLALTHWCVSMLSNTNCMFHKRPWGTACERDRLTYVMCWEGRRNGFPSQRATNAEITSMSWYHHIDGLVQERCNSIANALELHLSCTNHWCVSMLSNTNCMFHERPWGTACEHDRLTYVMYWEGRQSGGDELHVYLGTAVHKHGIP